MRITYKKSIKKFGMLEWNVNVNQKEQVKRNVLIITITTPFILIALLRNKLSAITYANIHLQY